MNLKSGISKSYNKAFVLDADSFRRIFALLEKSARELQNSYKVVVHAEREDDRFYETTDIDELLSDPNITAKGIKSVSIELRPVSQSTSPNDEWVVQIDFSLGWDSLFGRSVGFRISSENKNWALLLSDELEPQIQRTFKAKFTPRWLLALFIVPFIGIVYKLYPFIKSLPDYVQIIIAMIVTVPIIMLIGRTIDNENNNWFVRAFGPESVFLWGEEEHYYVDREKTRQNILWGIIIAFLISLVASIILLFLMN